jgi:hypothetical protein
MTALGRLPPNEGAAHPAAPDHYRSYEVDFQFEKSMWSLAHLNDRFSARN